MIYQIYEWHILRNINYVPRYLCFLVSEEEMKHDPNQIIRIIRWCNEISSYIQKKYLKENGIEEIMIHISACSKTLDISYYNKIKELSRFCKLCFYHGDQKEYEGFGLPVIVVIGKSGREEIADAIRAMAKDDVRPEDVSGEVLEKYLTFSHTPDCIIKTGGAHLVDFLIWQSVYSEFFFLDLNWENIRKIDLLRAFRDYQARNRDLEHNTNP
jgi:undecaprenyl diphosphate synthase